MGRNMFGPIRGTWKDEEWKGWWGPNPPYHSPVFVLTHHARKPIEMEGGTKFISLRTELNPHSNKRKRLRVEKIFVSTAVSQ
jgi:dihydrofolate reductase